MIDEGDDQFHWDFSYFKWQDIPRHVRRQMVLDASQFGRTWMHGRTWVVADIFKRDARRMYNNNWHGCRDLWKESYRKAKLYRLIDRPSVPPDPKIVEYERQYRERKQAKGDGSIALTETLRGVAKEEDSCSVEFMPQPDQEQTARKFQQFECTSPSSPRYDADYDREPPPDVRAELIRPKRPQILKRRQLPQPARFKWAWCLAVVLGALLATLLLGRVL